MAFVHLLLAAAGVLILAPAGASYPGVVAPLGGSEAFVVSVSSSPDVNLPWKSSCASANVQGLYDGRECLPPEEGPVKKRDHGEGWIGRLDRAPIRVSAGAARGGLAAIRAAVPRHLAYCVWRC